MQDGCTYLLFCGGTGILPFMDLFAYLLRRGVSIICPEKAYFPDEEFEFGDLTVILYAYYTAREDAIGLPIIEGLQVIQNKFRIDTGFRLNLTFTQEGGIRLTEN